jgi:outer membrane receptor protein involved in Fe transport
MELISLSSRLSLAGGTLKPATTINATLIVPAGRALEVTGTAANLFNVQYADPVSDAHRQDAIAQNGRTLRIGISWKFWSK